MLSLSTDQLHDACVCSSRQHPGVCSSRRPNQASLSFPFNCTFYVCLELVSPCCIKNHLERFLFPPVHVEIFCSAHDAQSQVRPWPATNTSVSLRLQSTLSIVLGYLLASLYGLRIWFKEYYRSSPQCSARKSFTLFIVVLSANRTYLVIFQYYQILPSRSKVLRCVQKCSFMGWYDDK